MQIYLRKIQIALQFIEAHAENPTLRGAGWVCCFIPRKAQNPLCLRGMWGRSNFGEFLEGRPKGYVMLGVTNVRGIHPVTNDASILRHSGAGF